MRHADEYTYISPMRKLRRLAWGGQTPLTDRLVIEKHLRLSSNRDIIYRPFREEDTAQLSKLLVENFPFGHLSREELVRFYSHDWVRKYAEVRHCHLLVTTDGTVLGSVGSIRYNGGRAEITTLQVDEMVRGLGLGKLLVVLAIEGHIKEGIRKFYTFAGSMSQRIFRQLGFQETSPFARLLTGVMSLQATVSDDMIRRLQAMKHATHQQITGE